MSRLSDWSPYERYVQAGMRDGEFANSSLTLIAAGPPRLQNLGGVTAFGSQLGDVAAAVGEEVGTAQSGVDRLAYPIGAVQNLAISQNNGVMEFFEIGSKRGFFITTRNVNQVSFGRFLYHGPSLLRTLYAYYEDGGGLGAQVDALFPNVGIKEVAYKHDVILSPGYETFFINLLSDLFSQPVGLLFLFKDSGLRTLGACYAEQTYVNTHSLATDAQGGPIQEQLQMQVERIIPVRVNAVPLLSQDAAAELEIKRGSGF